MFENIKTSVTTCKAVLLIMLTSFTLSWADVPPPPVNQNMGIPDSVFNNLERENCWYCHASSRLTDAERADLGWTFTPPTVKPGVITDRHHARVGTTMGENTQAPFGTPGDTYQCFSCHKIVWDENQSADIVVQNFTSCLNCHEQLDGKASVHHLTAPAQALDCKHCHGARINNPNDGHYIPTDRVPTLVTPRTSQGKGPNGEGACTFCHSDGVDVASGISVKSNAVNHHSTGIGQVGVSDLDCTLCHDQMGSDWAIRRCENCHGISSIHNIQTDSDGDGNITIGGEAPYYGHVGSSPTDCNGCHGGYIGASTAIPNAGPIVPSITGLSTFTITAGTTETIEVTGQALVNDVNSVSGLKRLVSKIVVTSLDGIETELTPESISATSIVVTIPPNLEPGSYYVRAVKSSKESNPISLVVKPVVAIASAEFLSGNTITVEGSGFGSYMGAIDSGTSISVDGALCIVDSWTDTLVVAECPQKCGALMLESIFGNATNNLSGDCDTTPTEPIFDPAVAATNSDYYWDIVTIDGSGFGDGTNTSVTVNGDTCRVSSWTDTKIVAEECPVRGCDTLVATNSQGSFTRLLDCGGTTPTEPIFDPAVAAIDSDYYWDIVTIDGSGFGDGTNTSVTVNGDTCRVSSWTDTKIVAEECPIRGCDTLIATSSQGDFTRLLDCN